MILTAVRTDTDITASKNHRSSHQVITIIRIANRTGVRYLTLLDLVKQKIKYFQTALEDMRDQEKKDAKKNELKGCVLLNDLR